ncbi:lipase secretion chaperone [Acinetobacter ihumii]|uniref:lipase secretion chaperone n=1 Tax=Acinetobacter ihumii TaxID=2483802 RepID=UPI001030D7A1|nr:lipase secretion chaperone [Acinetobacter ihumii]
MQGFRSNYLWIIMGIIVLIMIALVIGLKPQSSNGSTSTVSTDLPDQPMNFQSGDSSTLTMSNFHSQSQSDTQINCQLQLDNANHLIVNEQTRNCFEYFLTQYGEKTLAQIDQDMKKYLAQYLIQPARDQTQDLWQRYLKYREELADLKEPSLAKTDVAYYQAIFTSRQMLRQRFFSATEIEGLFGTEDIYNQYTLDRMAILNQPQLNEIEKAKQLKALFDQLPQDWKANLEQLSKLDDLRQLTASIKKNGGSAQQLHDMRTNLVGADATARLEQLDLERSNWKNNVTQYLNERQTILNSNMSDTAKQSAIDSLRNQAFATPQDQIRVHAFESAKDQGQSLPFSE